MFECVECRKPLAGVRYGWVTERVTWQVQGRVHTVCREKFRARPLDEQIAMTGRAEAAGKEDM